MKSKKKQYDESDEDNLALPGPKLTEEQLDKILAKGDGEGGYTSAQMKGWIKSRFAKSKIAGFIA